MSANVRSILRIGLLGIILAATLNHPLPAGFSNAVAATKPPQRLWEIDLTKFGYQGRPPIYLGPEDTGGTWTYKQGVVFTDASVVAAFFVVHDDPSGAVSGPVNPSSSDPFRLVAVFLNSQTGEFIKKQIGRAHV